MATALQISTQPTRATVTLNTIVCDDGILGSALVTTDDGDVFADIDLTADADMLVLVSHMMSPGETFGGHVVVGGDRIELVHIDDLTDFNLMFDGEDEHTGDPVIDCLIDMDLGCTVEGSDVGAFIIDGIPGIRLITTLMRGDDGECDFDRTREHVLLDMPIPETGIAASVVADALWAANYAEYAQAVSFYQSCLAARTDSEPYRHDGIFQKAIRSRTLLAGLGLVPNTSGRSYHVCDMQWIGCEVRTAADGWLEVSLKIDT